MRTRTQRLFALLFAVVALGAAYLRCVDLAHRPMHHDEANQAVRAGQLLEEGRYRYDPHEHHGPTLYYAFLPMAWATGAERLADTSEWTFRLIPAFFGVGVVLLLLGLTDGLGRGAVLASALLTAVSTALVFYSRFFIQEMLLDFFAVGAVVCGWRYFRARHAMWAVLTGLFVGLMHATKETCVLSYAAMAAGGVVAWWPGLSRVRFSPSTWRGRVDPRLCRHLLWGGLAAAGVSVVLYTSFFTNLRGPLDSVLTYLSYLSKAGGGGDHRHPPLYYLRLLLWFKQGAGPAWTEGAIIVFAVVGVIVGWADPIRSPADRGFVRFLTVYTGVLLVLYSAIPYKTPWCLVSFLHGLVLLAGVGVQWLWLCRPERSWRIAATLLVAVVAVHLLGQTWRSTHRYCADSRNPYVYAHTTMDYKRLPRRIEEVSAFHSLGRGMRIHVIAPPDRTWPLPWYLRRFPTVGYWTVATPEALEGDPAAMVTSVEVADRYAEMFREHYLTEYYGLRPGVLVALHIRRDLWSAFIESRR